MKKVLVTPATFEALEVDEIKVRPELRITGTSDDITLAAFIRSAVREYEDFTGHILCRSTWDLYLDTLEGEIELPAPLSSVTSITYLDTEGVSRTLATTYYMADSYSDVYGRIVLKYNQSWPSVYGQTNSVTVRFVAGYADPSDIPPRIIDGLMLKIQELYDGINRQDAYRSCWIQDARLPI